MQGKWECPKCHGQDYEIGQFAATGGGLSKFFDVQNKRFSTVSCARCRYTEIYQADTSFLENLFDFFSSH